MEDRGVNAVLNPPYAVSYFLFFEVGLKFHGRILKKRLEIVNIFFQSQIKFLFEKKSLDV